MTPAGWRLCWASGGGPARELDEYDGGLKINTSLLKRRRARLAFAGLAGSDINVHTNDYVVTLRGTVPSGTAKARAAAKSPAAPRASRASSISSS
jgi:hypothetical protein